MSARKRRIWRNTAFLMTVTVALIMALMAMRDAQSRQTCEDQLRFAIRAWRERQPGEALPLVFPLPLPAANGALRQHYRYLPERANRLALTRAAVICHCHEPHRLFLRANGRHVVTFDGEEFTLAWLTEDDFQERVAE